MCLHIPPSCKAYSCSPFTLYVSCATQSAIPIVLQGNDLTPSAQTELLP